MNFLHELKDGRIGRSQSAMLYLTHESRVYPISARSTAPRWDKLGTRFVLENIRQ